jgi:hypothetical protein
VARLISSATSTWQKMGPLAELEFLGLLVVDGDAADVRREKVGRALHAREGAAAGEGECAHKHGLGHPGHVFEEDMAAGEGRRTECRAPPGACRARRPPPPCARDLSLCRGIQPRYPSTSGHEYYRRCRVDVKPQGGGRGIVLTLLARRYAICGTHSLAPVWCSVCWLARTPSRLAVQTHREVLVRESAGDVLRTVPGRPARCAASRSRRPRG